MSGVMLVTDGGRGIGPAIVHAAAAKGHAICFSYRRDDEATYPADDLLAAAGPNGWIFTHEDGSPY
jgi:NAD(P)-dependent dehydrogenase (short-subunit alcohol dehydrogenase family)